MKRPADFNPHDECNTKRCRKCGETKSVAEFIWNKRDGIYENRCYDCKRLYEKERWRRIGRPPRLGRKRRYTDWTLQEIAKLRECIDANMTSHKAAAEIGRSVKAVRCQRLRQGLPPFRKKKQTGLRRGKWPAARVALLKQLRDRKATFDVCAAALSVTRNSVAGAVDRYLKQEARP